MQMVAILALVGMENWSQLRNYVLYQRYIAPLEIRFLKMGTMCRVEMAATLALVPMEK